MNSAHNMVRPNIPKDWYQPETSMLIVYLIYSFGSMAGFGYLSYQLYISDMSFMVKAPLLILTMLLTSCAIHLVGWFSHDGIHLSLAKNKYASILIGTFVGAAATFPTIGYGITHWTHHRFTNQESDPDTIIYSKYKSFWVRFFLSRYIANRGYYKNTFLLIFNKPLGFYYPMPFSQTEIRLLAVFSIVSIMLWVSLYAYILLNYPVYGVVAILIPYLLTMPITGLRIYVEHAGTDAGIYRNTRTYSSPFYTILLFGNNFHLEHHLYPRVPCYKLLRVHNMLKKHGYFKEWQAHIVPGILKPLKYTTGSYQYPEALSPDESADPFDINNRSPMSAQETQTV